jgi:phosphomannomutase
VTSQGKLMAGVSGVRGVVGETLTPEILLRYAAAFAATLGPGPVVFGRDSRPSGPALRHAVLAGLLGAGRDVLELGIVPTPTVQLEVERHQAAGGIALTASHNPVEWNALKFVGPTGRFLGPKEAAAFLASVDGPLPAVRWDALGSRTDVPDAVRHHVDLILELEEVDRDRVARARPRVILDAVHGAGGATGRMLLERLGCDVTVLFEEPTGRFPRPPEPVAGNLGALAAEVKARGADLGLAFDPDVDRLSLVDETGTAVGEECTLALAADHVLGVRPGPVVTNLSTSARLEAVAARHGQTVTRTPVGEANVVEGIVAEGARIGGEGNGGVILPALHLGRDAPAGAALILTGLATRGESLSRWVGTLPDLHMVKARVELVREPDWKAVEAAIQAVIPGARADRRDGIRLAEASEWVHLRKSGTEPIIRVIAEAASPERAGELVRAARNALS